MKVYIIVREDILSNAQKTVQAAHAVAELCINHDVKQWALEHKTMVVLGLKQGWKMNQIFKDLNNQKKALFIEPDLNHEPTACAFLKEVDEPITEKLNLLKER